MEGCADASICQASYLIDVSQTVEECRYPCAVVGKPLIVFSMGRLHGELGCRLTLVRKEQVAAAVFVRLRCELGRVQVHKPDGCPRLVADRRFDAINAGTRSGADTPRLNLTAKGGHACAMAARFLQGVARTGVGARYRISADPRLLVNHDAAQKV